MDDNSNDEILIVPIRLGPDPVESEEIGELRLRKTDLINALAPYVRTTVSSRLDAEQGRKTATVAVESLFGAGKEQFASALREWTMGELVWSGAIATTKRIDLVRFVVALAQTANDAALKQLLGSGPLAREICGHFGLRFITPAKTRRAMANALFNLGRPGRPSTLPPRPRLQVMLDHYESRLMPLSKAVAENNANPLGVFDDTDDMLRFIRESGMDKVWAQRNWMPHGHKQDKVSARSLACELMAAMYGVSPQYFSRALPKRVPRKGKRRNLTAHVITVTEVRPDPPRVRATENRPKASPRKQERAKSRRVMSRTKK